MPVTTPSAPSPSCSQLASRPSSVNESGVEQPRDALADRQLALLGGRCAVALGAAGACARRRRPARVSVVVGLSHGPHASGRIRTVEARCRRPGGGGSGPARSQPDHEPGAADHEQEQRPADERAATGPRQPDQQCECEQTATTPKYAGPGSRSPRRTRSPEPDGEQVQLPAEPSRCRSVGRSEAASANRPRRADDRAGEQAQRQARPSDSAPAALTSCTACRRRSALAEAQRAAANAERTARSACARNVPDPVRVEHPVDECLDGDGHRRAPRSACTRPSSPRRATAPPPPPRPRTSRADRPHPAAARRRASPPAARARRASGSSPLTSSTE